MQGVTVCPTVLCSPEYDRTVAEYSRNPITIQPHVHIRFSNYCSTDMRTKEYAAAS
jgi:hypothetical protein